MDPLLLAGQLLIMRISSADNSPRGRAIMPVVGLWLIAGLAMAFATAAGVDSLGTPQPVQQAETMTGQPY
jgi:hypothetical protein